MADRSIRTSRLELRPLPVAAALPHERASAARLLGLSLPDAWPQADLLDVLPLQAAAPYGEETFGAWIVVERESGSVVGDIGFMGPPGEDGTVEIGYGVIPDRQGRGYATEAARALVDWVLGQPPKKVAQAVRIGRDQPGLNPPNDQRPELTRSVGEGRRKRPGMAQPPRAARERQTAQIALSRQPSRARSRDRAPGGAHAPSRHARPTKLQKL